MIHYDPKSALEELAEESVLPTPVRLRDMIIRTHLPNEDLVEVNRQFQGYLKQYGESLQIARGILSRLAEVSKGHADC